MISFSWAQVDWRNQYGLLRTNAGEVDRVLITVWFTGISLGCGSVWTSDVNSSGSSPHRGGTKISRASFGFDKEQISRLVVVLQRERKLQFVLSRQPSDCDPSVPSVCSVKCSTTSAYARVLIIPQSQVNMSHLPTEIHQLVIQNFLIPDDYSTLCRTSLVCNAWKLYSREIMFRALHMICTPANYEARADARQGHWWMIHRHPRKFAEDTASSDLASCVESLRLSGPMIGVDAARNFIHELDCVTSRFARLGSIWNRLKTLTLVRFPIMDAKVIELLNAAFPLGQITTLRLKVIKLSPLDVASLLQLCTHLEELDLDFIASDDKTPLQIAYPLPAVLRLNPMDESVSTWFTPQSIEHTRFDWIINAYFGFNQDRAKLQNLGSMDVRSVEFIISSWVTGSCMLFEMSSAVLTKIQGRKRSNMPSKLQKSSKKSPFL